MSQAPINLVVPVPAEELQWLNAFTSQLGSIKWIQREAGISKDTIRRIKLLGTAELGTLERLRAFRLNREKGGADK